MDAEEEANRSSDDVDRRDRERASVLGSAGIAAVVASLGLVKPELLPLYTAAGGPAQLVLNKLLGLTGDRRTERVNYTLGLGIDQAGVSAEEFERLCEEDPNLVQLCTKIALAAQDAIFQGKLDGLALSLTSALEDGSRVDAEILFATVLGQLERPHVRLLAQLERNPAGTVLAPDAKPEDFPNPSYNRAQIVMLDPGLEDVIEPLMGVLISSGLIQSTFRGGGIGAVSVGPQDQSYAINSFGRLILTRIRSQVVQLRARPSDP